MSDSIDSLQAYLIEKAAGLVPDEDDMQIQQILQMMKIAKEAAESSEYQNNDFGPEISDGHVHKNNNKKKSDPQAAKDRGADESHENQSRSGNSSGKPDEDIGWRHDTSHWRGSDQSSGAHTYPSGGKKQRPRNCRNGSGSGSAQHELPAWRQRIVFIRQLFTALSLIALNTVAHYGFKAVAVLPEVLPWIAGDVCHSARSLQNNCFDKPIFSMECMDTHSLSFPMFWQARLVSARLRAG